MWVLKDILGNVPGLKNPELLYQQPILETNDHSGVIHSNIQQLFVESLAWARPCTGPWVVSPEQS